MSSVGERLQVDARVAVDTKEPSPEEIVQEENDVLVEVTLDLLVDAVKVMTAADWQAATDWPDWTAADLEVLHGFGIHRDPRKMSIGEQVEVAIDGLEAVPLRRFVRVLTKPTLAAFHRALLADLANPSYEQLRDAATAAIEARSVAAVRLQLTVFADEGGRYAAHAARLLAEDERLRLAQWSDADLRPRNGRRRADVAVDVASAGVAADGGGTRSVGGDDPVALRRQLDELLELQGKARDVLTTLLSLVDGGHSLAGSPSASPVEDYARAHHKLARALTEAGVLGEDADDLSALDQAVAQLEQLAVAEQEHRQRIGRLADLAPAHGAPVDLDAVAAVRRQAAAVAASGTRAVDASVLASLDEIVNRLEHPAPTASAAEAFALQQELVHEHQALALPLLAGGLELAT